MRHVHAQHISTGGQTDKAGGAHPGDTLVMITAPNGKVSDLRRWSRPRPPPHHSKLPPKDTSRVVSQLGPWRECAVDVAAAEGSEFEEVGSTFFYHLGTRKRSWRFEMWGQVCVGAWVEREGGEGGGSGWMGE